MINIIRINLDGGREAQRLTLQNATEQNADIAILSEFYKYGRIHEKWYCDSSNRSAIAVLSSLPVDDVGVGNNGFVWVTIGGTRVYSCSWSPNTTDIDYEDLLKRLEASIRSSSCNVILAEHFEWSSPVNDVKGEALVDMAQALDLVVCNRGNKPTREKDEQQSFIDAY